MSMQDNMDPNEPDDANVDDSAPATPKLPFNASAYQASRLLDDFITRKMLAHDDEAKRMSGAQAVKLEDDLRALVIGMIEKAWRERPTWKLGALLAAAARSVAGPDASVEHLDDLALIIGLAAVAEPVDAF